MIKFYYIKGRKRAFSLNNLLRVSEIKFFGDPFPSTAQKDEFIGPANVSKLFLLKFDNNGEI